MLRWNIKFLLAGQTKILLLFIVINWQVSLYSSIFAILKHTSVGLSCMNRISWFCRRRSVVSSLVSGLSCGLWLALAWPCGWQSGTSDSDLLVSCLHHLFWDFPSSPEAPCSPVLRRVIPGRRRNLVPGLLSLLFVSPLSLTFSILLVLRKKREAKMWRKWPSFSEPLVFSPFSKKNDFSWDMYKICHQ